jgi:hypothetical protein
MLCRTGGAAGSKTEITFLAFKTLEKDERLTAIF